MKAAIISDTHDLLRPEVADQLRACDAIIHAGDISSKKIVDQILACRKKDAPFYVVRGNNDKEWAEGMPESLIFTLARVKFFLVHNKKDVPKELGDCRIVIYGHSHKYAEEQKDGRLWLNPGSCGKRRFTQPVTMAILHLERGEWQVERIDIGQVDAGAGGRNVKSKAAGENVPLADLPATVDNILKRMEKGQTVTKISRDLKLEPDFVETVCRIKVTHPGVMAAGIVDKMEVNRAVEK